MATFEIRDAKLPDCGKLARMLRAEHAAALVRVGVNSHQELRTTFQASYIKKALLIDGTLAGLGGVAGSLLSPIGFAWVALTDRATRYPIGIVREVRKYLAEVMTMKAELHTTIMVDDAAALRLAIFIGFHVADNGLGAAAETRAGRRTLREYIMSTPELMIPFRGSNLIRMGFHADTGDLLPRLAN